MVFFELQLQDYSYVNTIVTFTAVTIDLLLLADCM